MPNISSERTLETQEKKNEKKKLYQHSIIWRGRR